MKSLDINVHIIQQVSPVSCEHCSLVVVNGGGKRYERKMSSNDQLSEFSHLIRHLGI